MNPTMAAWVVGMVDIFPVTLVPGPALTAGTVLGCLGGLSGKFRPLIPGRDVAAAVLLRDVGSSRAERYGEIPLVATIRGSALLWPEGVTDEQKAKALAELRASNIRVQR